MVLIHKRPPGDKLMVMLGRDVPTCGPRSDVLELLQILLVATDLLLPVLPLGDRWAIDVGLQIANHFQKNLMELVLKLHQFGGVAHDE